MPEIISFFAVYLAVFLFGMTVMRIGMQTISQDRIRKYLLILTSSPLMGVIAGTVLTGLLQSSSAVMVITIGLVATRYLSFKQSLGIILGANIGTTFTTELITFDVSKGIVPMLIIGSSLLLFRMKPFFNIGCILFGLGSIFVAMNGFEHLAADIVALPLASSLFTLADQYHYAGIGIGTVVTAVIQSSTATTGIIMGFLSSHSLTIDTGIAIMLGSNIGTCITAFLASIGSNKEAKLVAYAHIWLNVLGVLLFYPFISYLSGIVQSLVTAPDIQLAHASLIFNVLCTVIALPLIGIFSRFILTVHGKH